MNSWRAARVAFDRTHHVLGDPPLPLYKARFLEVMKFHAPGLAPVLDTGGAYHIDELGRAAYEARFRRTFGFYEGLAAVEADDGFHHILPDGRPAYSERHDWCGNFQEERCPVRDGEHRYVHINALGERAYAARYRYAGDFRDGSAVVQGDDGLHTHIDKDGRPVHHRWFLDLDVFHKGFARARDEGGYMHVDREGRPAYARRFAAVEPFYNGQARAERFDGGLVVIREDGEPLVELRPATRSELAALSGDMVGFWRTHAIAAAVELGLFEALPATVKEIAARLPLHEERGERLLRACGELGLVQLDREDGQTFRLTSRGDLLRREHPLSLGDAALYWAHAHKEAWEALPSAIQRGGGWSKPTWFEALAATPGRVASYHRAMASYARHDYKDLGGAIDASQHRTLVDAGGGTGALLEQVLRAHPHLTGLLLERPEVAACAELAPDVRDRCEVRAADIFEPWGARADAVLLARVLHDWDDRDAGRILARAREAIEPGGRLYVLEMARDPGSFSGSLLDLHMLLATGGRERTEAEIRELFAGAGLRHIATRRLPPTSSVSVFVGEIGAARSLTAARSGA